VAIWIIYPGQQNPSYATDLKILRQFQYLPLSDCSWQLQWKGNNWEGLFIICSVHETVLPYTIMPSVGKTSVCNMQHILDQTK